MKKILFIPSLAYLSYPMFKVVSGYLVGEKLIYFDPDYSEHKKTFSGYDEKLKELECSFNEIVIFDEKHPAHEGTQNKIIARIILSKKYRKIIHEIKRIAPDAIVLGDDSPYVFNICNTYFSKLSLFVLQHGGWDVRRETKTNYSAKSILVYYVYKHLLKIPLFPVSPLPLCKARRKNYFTYLLWSDYYNVNPKINHIPVGNPILDKFISVFDNRGNDIEKYEYYKSSVFKEKIICYSTQPLDKLKPGIEVNIVNMLVATLEKLNDLRIIIKIHPRESKQKYQNLFQHLDKHRIHFVHKEKEIAQILSKSFLAVTAMSSTVYHSISMGIPTILLNPEYKMDYSEQFPIETLPIVASSTELIREIKKLDNINGYLTFLKKRKLFLVKANTNTGPVSGKLASEVMVKKIEEQHMNIKSFQSQRN